MKIVRCEWSIATASNVVTSGADSMGHGGKCPNFYKWLGTRGTVSRRTANKNLTKLYRPSWKRSPKRLIVLLEPKSGGHDQKNSSALRRTSPSLKISFGATVSHRQLVTHFGHVNDAVLLGWKQKIKSSIYTCTVCNVDAAYVTHLKQQK